MIRSQSTVLSVGWEPSVDVGRAVDGGAACMEMRLDGLLWSLLAVRGKSQSIDSFQPFHVAYTNWNVQIQAARTR